MNEIASEWIAKADNDYFSADMLLHAGEVPIIDTACFHCQQCAEKYLKAFLQENAVRFERTHVLASLLELCTSVDQDFSKIAGDLDSLEGYAVAIRYPVQSFRRKWQRMPLNQPRVSVSLCATNSESSV